jgi:BlaI family transcriptional regulator, penicillinase repressor
MSKRKQPTEAELTILQVLWRRGPCTVREVHEVLNQEKQSAYTTTLKFLQIMTEKGLVQRDESQRTHIYRARISEEKTQGHLVDDLLQRVFGGSAQKLVMRALASKKTTPEELAEIRRLLDELEGGKS